MRKVVAALAVASLLTFSATALAEVGHPSNSSVQKEHAEQPSTESHGGSNDHSDMPNMTPEEHQNMPMEPSTDGHGESSDHSEMLNMSPEEHQNMPSDPISEGHGGEGHGGGPVVETPPNYKVLGAFGAINATFILIGIWNKWFRRKGSRACQV